MPSENFRRQKEELERNAKKSVVDYSGHIPSPQLRALPRTFDQVAFQDAVSKGAVIQSPIQSLIDEMIEKTNEAREKILRNLIDNPGILATFENNFVVEFGDIEIETLDSPDTLNEYRLAITQKWRIRRREEEDGPAGTPLGRDS